MKTPTKVHISMPEHKPIVLPVVAVTTNRAGDVNGYVCKAKSDGLTPATEWFPAQTKQCTCTPIGEQE